MGIRKDIQTGALPAEEIPGFVWWLVRKSFWVFFALLVIGALLLTVK